MIDKSQWTLREPNKSSALEPQQLIGYLSSNFSQTPAFTEFTLNAGEKAARFEEATTLAGDFTLTATLKAVVLSGEAVLAEAPGLFAFTLREDGDLRLYYVTELDSKERYTTLLKGVPLKTEFSIGLSLEEGAVSAYAKVQGIDEPGLFNFEVEKGVGATQIYVGLSSESEKHELIQVRYTEIDYRRGASAPLENPEYQDPNGNAPVSSYVEAAKEEVKPDSE